MPGQRAQLNQFAIVLIFTRAKCQQVWGKEMKISGYWLRRQIASSLVLFLAVPFGEAATAWSQQALPNQQVQGASSAQSQPENPAPATNNPAANTPQPEAFPVAPASAQTIAPNPQSGTLPSAPEQQQNSTSTPVGTALAPYKKTVGVASSKPAGAAIAPAKQRRARSILIKVGVLLGACVAIGVVAALSIGSPSRP